MSVAPICNLIVDLISGGLSETSAQDVGATFFTSLQKYGAKALFTRSTEHGRTNILARISPTGWEDLYADKQFAAVNYLNRELKDRDTPFRWSEIVLKNKNEQRLSNALKDFGFSDGLAIPLHSSRGTGVTSIAFERLERLSGEEIQAIEVAGLILHDRMRRLQKPQGGSVSILTPRERDCIAFMSDGLKDADIALRLGISANTVITHMNSARRKLKASTRAHMVAISLVQGLL